MGHAQDAEPNGEAHGLTTVRWIAAETRGDPPEPSWRMALWRELGESAFMRELFPSAGVPRSWAGVSQVNGVASVWRPCGTWRHHQPQALRARSAPRPVLTSWMACRGAVRTVGRTPAGKASAANSLPGKSGGSRARPG